MSHSGKVLVAGLGSPHGDDQAGWFVAEQLLKKISAPSEASYTAWNEMMRCRNYQNSEPGNDSIRSLTTSAAKNVVVRRAMIPLDVLDWLEGVSILHVCDACETTERYDQLHRFEWNAGQLVHSDRADDSDASTAVKLRGGRGSHDFGLADVLRLAEKTGMLPKQVIIWAIAGKCFQPKDVMSDETRETVCQATNAVMRELSMIGRD